MMLTNVGIEQNLYASTLVTAMAGGIKKTFFLSVVVHLTKFSINHYIYFRFRTAMMEFKTSLVC